MEEFGDAGKHYMRPDMYFFSEFKLEGAYGAVNPYEGGPMCQEMPRYFDGWAQITKATVTVVFLNQFSQ